MFTFVLISSPVNSTWLMATCTILVCREMWKVEEKAIG